METRSRKRAAEMDSAVDSGTLELPRYDSTRGSGARGVERGTGRGIGRRGQGAARTWARSTKYRTQHGPPSSKQSTTNYDNITSTLSTISTPVPSPISHSSPPLLHSSPPLPSLAEAVLHELSLSLEINDNGSHSENSASKSNAEAIEKRAAQYVPEFRAKLQQKEAEKKAKSVDRKWLQAQLKAKREAELQTKKHAEQPLSTC